MPRLVSAGFGIVDSVSELRMMSREEPTFGMKITSSACEVHKMVSESKG